MNLKGKRILMIILGTRGKWLLELLSLAISMIIVWNLNSNQSWGKVETHLWTSKTISWRFWMKKKHYLGFPFFRITLRLWESWLKTILKVWNMTKNTEIETKLRSMGMKSTTSSRKKKSILRRCQPFWRV